MMMNIVLCRTDDDNVTREVDGPLEEGEEVRVVVCSNAGARVQECTRCFFVEQGPTEMTA